MKMTTKQFIRLRKRLGLSQKQFGEVLNFGSPQPRVSEIERGKRGVSAHVAALCKFIEKEHANESANA